MVDPDFVDDTDGINYLSYFFLDTVEISLNAVGKASVLKVRKIKIKRRYTFQNLITFIKTQLEKGGAL